VFERPLRYLAITLGAIVALSFGLFAWEQTREASDATTAAIAAGTVAAQVAPSPTQERVREAAHTTAREAIDDANDVLTSPFANLVSGFNSGWARRGVSGLLAFLLWGVGLGYLARYSAGKAKARRAGHHEDHGLYPERQPVVPGSSPPGYE
jgi:hypothetical protein